jgi:hypothetical protein
MIPSPKKPSFAMRRIVRRLRDMRQLRSDETAVLVTKRVFPEAIEYLKAHVDVDYVDSEDGLSPADLLERLKGKQAPSAR